MLEHIIEQNSPNSNDKNNIHDNSIKQNNIDNIDMLPNSKNRTFSNNLEQNSPKDNKLNILKKFHCEYCDYSCNKKSDWKKHIMTLKHKSRQNSPKVANNSPKVASKFKCNCGKIYNHRNSYWYHKKKCYINEKNNNYKQDTNILDSSSIIDKEILIKMLLQNQDVMNKIVDILPQVGMNNSHNTNHSHNKTFNIQMFLNEHCKNAMNLTDFIESLPITAETYDNTLENGLTKSMTHLITNGLSQLDVLERPIHCTDTARKTLYVKENNAWEKDNELFTLMKGVKKVIFKQRTMLKKWQNANEGWDTNELLQEKMTRLVFHSMADINNDEREMGKIIRAISKNVYLDNETKNKFLSY